MTTWRDLAAKYTGGRIGASPTVSVMTGPLEWNMSNIAKLAPPAQPEHATIHWLNECLARGRESHFTETVVMTPGVAQALLSANPNNRNVSERRTEAYAHDMIEGRWVLNGEPIIVATTGELNDGQHRLHAIILSNRPQLMDITFGVARETRTTVDQGAARTVAHYLAMDGINHSALRAGIARIVMSYERSKGEFVKTDLTSSEVLQRCRADDGLLASAEFSERVRKYAKSILSPSQIGACHYLFSEINVHDANAYMTQLCIGENIKRHDPAFTIRQALENMKGDRRQERIELTMRGFIAYRQGRKLQVAKSLGSLPSLV